MNERKVCMLQKDCWSACGPRLLWPQASRAGAEFVGEHIGGAGFENGSDPLAPAGEPRLLLHPCLLVGYVCERVCVCLCLRVCSCVHARAHAHACACTRVRKIGWPWAWARAWGRDGGGSGGGGGRARMWGARTQSASSGLIPTRLHRPVVVDRPSTM